MARAQIGLGISETEHIGDDPDEMGENLKTANLGGEILFPSWPSLWSWIVSLLPLSIGELLCDVGFAICPGV